MHLAKYMPPVEGRLLDHFKAVWSALAGEGGGVEWLTSPGLLCLAWHHLLTVFFISESLIVTDSWSKYKVLPSSPRLAVQAPFPSGYQAQILVADSSLQALDNLPSHLRHQTSFCSLYQAGLPCGVWREEGGRGARPEAWLHTSESFVNEFSFPMVKAQRDKGICLFEAGNSDIHLLCEFVF